MIVTLSELTNARHDTDVLLRGATRREGRNTDKSRPTWHETRESPCVGKAGGFPTLSSTFEGVISGLDPNGFDAATWI